MRLNSPLALGVVFTFCFNFASFALNREGLLLLEVKRSLYDPAGFLSGWSDRDGSPCNWTGIACDRRGWVVYVVLSNASLYGSFPNSVCRLRHLTKLSFYNNWINSSLPSSISACRRLVYLDLSNNVIVGLLPSALAELRFLRVLNLEANNFSGEIPSTFGQFRRLETLILTENYLTGSIPATLGNVTTLKKLILAYNRLRGQLPPELGNLTNLEELWLSNCNFTGTMPESFGRLHWLKNLDVSGNILMTGQITILLQLRNIEQIELYNNNFSGPLPVGWSNLTKLRRFDGSMNQFTGVIPDELCQLPLESLNIFENQLEGVIPASIAKSRNLRELKLFGNHLSGSLPDDLGKMSALQTIDVSYSNLSGPIPKFLCKNGALVELILLDNAFTGPIPEDLAKCQTLERIRLLRNKLDGQVPAEFWGLPRAYLLDLSENALSGSISPLIRSAKSLATLAISKNEFSGNIPNEIGSLNALVEFSANGNKLSGEIPSDFWNLAHLERLELSSNSLSGGIPNGIQNMKALNELNLADNQLSGWIPDEIGRLPVLNYLDLSRNNFSGSIPLSLQNLKLNEFNLSSNMLSGAVPPLFASGAFKDSFLGNPGLCMDDSGSGLCNRSDEKQSHAFSWMLISVFVIAGIVFVIGIVLFLLKYRKLRQVKKEVFITKWTSFHRLGFSEFEISTCLKEGNVIGRGASGVVYKVDLRNGESVAVKKLHETPMKDEAQCDCSSVCNVDEFCVEVETLGKIRHKNIVKLWCCCDTNGCKLLVYEYMPNGSLGEMLHCRNNNNSKSLDWPSRFNIVLDAAEGLSYLHHDSVPPIVHRDVKSNNILLDEGLRAKISDFGVAKVVKMENKGVQSMSVIAGSCGYIAPEYAYTLRVNEKSDIYSFGIVVLELVTGKPPVSSENGEKDLSAWVRTALDSNGIDDVVDPKLDSRFRQHICKVLSIGLLCTSYLPINRPSMRSVVNMLQELSAGLAAIPENDSQADTQKKLLDIQDEQQINLKSCFE